MDRREHSLGTLEEKSETCTCPQLPQSTTPRKKKNKIKNKRRFSDEQIKSLESIFESETKLEPRKKLQLARELELTPRQVAIWFQNKRARWKSKQIEQEYRRLRTNYDNLESQYESLMKEKQSLLLQLQKLSEMLGKPQEKEWNCSKVVEASSSEGGSDHGHVKYEPADSKPSPSHEGMEHRGFVFSHNVPDSRRNGVQLAEERHELVDNLSEEYIDRSLASPEKWYSFDSDGPSNMSLTNSQWLSFWT